MKTKLLALSELWEDFFIAAGVIGIFSILGFYAREFAIMAQANLFLGNWGLF